MSSHGEIITPAVSDWEKVRDLRLRSLQTDPQAYGRTYEETLLMTDRDWQERLVKANAIPPVNYFFVAQKNSLFIGSVGAIELSTDSWRVVSMYVVPEERGKGIGETLFGTILDALKQRGGVHTVFLNVNSSQETAIALYKKHGFAVIETEHGRRFGDGNAYDSFTMKKSI